MAMEKQQLLTYDDYRALPDDGKLYQLIDGELIVTPAPKTQHQRIVVELIAALSSYLKANPLGIALLAPYDVVLSHTRVFQPDVLYVSNEHRPIITEDNVQGAPDLVIEVLSPASFREDVGRKKRSYQEAGVTEYWIVWQDVPRIEVYRLSDTGKYGNPILLEEEDALSTPLLPGFNLLLADLYKPIIP